jgi:LDH2 family malate/lactate/ureidoglycolate dehydrogenase
LLDSKENVGDRLDTLLVKVRSCEKAAGVERIRTPGENASDMERRRRVEGIPFTADEVENLNQLAKNSGSDALLVNSS